MQEQPYRKYVLENLCCEKKTLQLCCRKARFKLEVGYIKTSTWVVFLPPPKAPPVLCEDMVHLRCFALQHYWVLLIQLKGLCHNYMQCTQLWHIGVIFYGSKRVMGKHYVALWKSVHNYYSIKKKCFCLLMIGWWKSANLHLSH